MGGIGWIIAGVVAFLWYQNSQATSSDAGGALPTIAPQASGGGIARSGGNMPDPAAVIASAPTAGPIPPITAPVPTKGAPVIMGPPGPTNAPGSTPPIFRLPTGTGLPTSSPYPISIDPFPSTGPLKPETLANANDIGFSGGGDNTLPWNNAVL
jgi:hypothetical protein